MFVCFVLISSVVNLIYKKQLVVLLTVNAYSEYQFAECNSADCHFAECCGVYGKARGPVLYNFLQP